MDKRSVIPSYRQAGKKAGKAARRAQRRRDVERAMDAGASVPAFMPDRAGRFSISASDPKFFGVRAGVQFTGGVGRTDSIEKAEALRAQGFGVDERTNDHE